ncbi:hypothetical protein LTR56_001249 [Elasticomyces elasticus]|nr:hypothetical protein LTR56_001249 [Elasticomyces elasticus]KAK3667431.1 hypothetical protein LTR22_001609 [Elasticomyces elasticus]KAK5760500.1 hypothetical protein LTS12_009373 [Elasticomyces elasticus]
MAPIARFESEKVDASSLGEPLKYEFSGRTAPNRFMKGAMTERLSSWDPKNLEARGIPSKELINAYRRWGEGEIGNILTGNVMIEYDHLEASGNPIVPRGAPYEGERFEAFKEMAEVAKKHGSLMVAQVSHPGRQVQDLIQPNPVSASAIQLSGNVMGMTFAKPRAAAEEDIANIIEGFAHAAEYLEKAGYDGVELHGAHGYLLAQFLSPTTNQRTDKYGGSLENRARLVFEIAQEIRKRTSPSFILGIKLNSVEFQDKGLTPEDAKQMCVLLEQNSFDFVELSGGTYESLAFEHKKESTKKREAFFMDFADLIAPELHKTKVYVTGGFQTVAAMVDARKTVDGIGLARALCHEPQFCKDILAGKVTGTVKPAMDLADIGPTIVIAGTQIRQIGKDHQPIDMTRPENVQGFFKDLGMYMETKAKDTDNKSYGFMDITSSPIMPYGVASV